MAAVARDTGIGKLIGTLLGRTALGGVQTPFESFGPIAAATLARGPALAQRAEPGILENLAQAAVFTAEEARRRLGAFLSGAFKPGAGGELVAYLKQNLLGLEKRSYGDAKPTIHVVDALTNQSVPAAAVHRRMVDRNLEKSLQRDPGADRRTMLEAQAALSQRQALAPFLRHAVDTGKPAFSGWDDVAFTLPAALKGKAYTVRNGEGYIGTAVGACAMTPEKTREFLLERQQELSQKLGRKVQFVYDQNMTPGSPILLADAQLVRARKIDPSLAADRLEAAYGKSFTDHYRGLNKGPVAGQDNVVSLDQVAAFRARFKKKDPAPEAAPAVSGTGFGFGGPEAPAPVRTFDPRHVVIQCGDGAPKIWHSKRQKELVDVPSMHLLPAGEYLKEDEFGMPMGKLKVDADGNLTHTTMDGLEHNFDGASFEPAPGSALPKRWAIEGERFDRFRDFKERRDGLYAADRPAVETAPQPEPEAESTGFGFGR